MDRFVLPFLLHVTGKYFLLISRQLRSFEQREIQWKSTRVVATGNTVDTFLQLSFPLSGIK